MLATGYPCGEACEGYYSFHAEFVALQWWYRAVLRKHGLMVHLVSALVRLLSEDFRGAE